MAADAVADETGLAEFGILGPLEVRRSGRAVPLGGPRQRAVLALLLLEANRAVSMDRLAEEVWAGDPPDGWVTTLQTYVFHLRRALEPDRLRGAAGSVLVTRGRSYLLRVDREHLDAARFQDGFTAGRAALGAGRYAEGAGTLRQALDMWRGEVLADLADYAFIQPEAVRLEDLRLAALEARIEGDLALGRHDALTAELERLAARHPLRERLHGQLMLALYRCGRQAEALACYRRVRDLLAGELGIDPGEPLRRLHEAVLAHDPALDWDGGRRAPPDSHQATAARGAGPPLREAVTVSPYRGLGSFEEQGAGFVGREGELSRLQGALGEARLVLVVGDAGVGKTRFVTEGLRRTAGGAVAGVWGGCLPLAEKLPLLPVAGALGELSRADGGRLVEAALSAVPGYVRQEVERLVPRLGHGGTGPGEQSGGWQRERLFSAVGELLGTVAAGRPVCVVVEDVHWADSSTLDCLTFLAHADGLAAVTLVVTCRSDEAPLDRQVADWLAHVRGGRGVEEIRLAPLSREEVAELVAGLWGGPPPPVAEELYDRAEGNPFFTEQLVAAMLAGAAGSGLPARLAELLAARAGRCGGDGQAVLTALAVAGRPLAEDQLAGVSGLAVEAVRRGLRQLAEARLLADDTSGGAHRPRHALLAEAVTAGLLPGERVVLHERTAQLLEAVGGDALAAEAASHWAAAGHGAEELAARLAAAGAAERVFGYAEAGAHWERAIDLYQTLPGAVGADLPRLYVRAVDAAVLSGDTRHASVLAEEAYRRFASHPDHATAAVICQRAGYLRGLHTPDAGYPLVERALELFELSPPSTEHAEALRQYAVTFLLYPYGRRADSHTALTQALEIAEAASATAVIPRILADLADDAFWCGEIREGFATLHRARATAEAAGDSAALLNVAVAESWYLLVMGNFARAEEVALRGLHAARRAGLAGWFRNTYLVVNAAEAMWSQGHTAEAAALIDPLTAGPPGRDDWFVYLTRALLDMLRGDHEAAAARQQQVNAVTGHFSNISVAYEAARLTVEAALWAGRPGEALQQVQHALAPYEDAPDLTAGCGELLAAGQRACADLAERARARRDHDAARAAQTAASELASTLERMRGVPFTDHPYVAAIPGNRATWDAEQTRLAGSSDPDAWHAAAKTWESLGWPHRTGYAWWRHAEALLDAGQPTTAATAALRAAAAATDGHAPLTAQIRALAQRARIPLQAPSPADPAAPRTVDASALYGLTARELRVLRLLGAGRTNAQIGAELYISPRTAGVHVGNILRKLGVTNRVQAAAIAERAGLLPAQQS
jgi:DNA-binding SARP family transcriptional activator/DNA-binding CsgD family transcriptional regulator